MSFEDLMTILKDTTLTDYQRAANIHAALTKASQPFGLNIRPATPRKKREPRAPKPNGHLDLTPHEEATP